MKARVAYLRNFIFGIDDSLVSTVGLLSGIASAGVAAETIVLSGVVLIFVEAFSMAAGSYLSEASAEEYTAQNDVKTSHSLKASLIMFSSYFVAGFVPLFPYIMAPVETAFPLSIAVSIAALLVLGAWSGKISNVSVFKSAVRMGIIGGVAIALGVIVGIILG
ncbi:hypothetical protein C4585_03340 [Candidatus Parcubacteria bacterium]|nr:MAG: hypothetical protein C4585_03340 [Candidatus Parcubacteria bacterium]